MEEPSLPRAETASPPAPHRAPVPPVPGTASPAAARARSRRAIRVLAVLLSTAVGLLLVELAVRVLPVPLDGNAGGERLHHDPRRPHASARRWHPPPGSFRIVAFGDSFTRGHTDADAYPHRLQEVLDPVAPGAPRFSVLNAGEDGLNTVMEARTIRRWLRLCPDLLLLGFCLNDPEPYTHDRRQALQARFELLRRRPAHGLAVSLHRRSALFRLVYARLENQRQHRQYTAYYRHLFDEREPRWPAAADALTRIRDDARRAGVPLAVVVFPIFGPDLGAGYPYRFAHAKVGDLCRRLGLPVLDLLHAYQGLEPRRLALVPFTDPHPSPLANRIAAEEILAFLVDQGLVPSARELPEPGAPRVR